MAYQLYRNTTLGNSLQESLDELIQVTLTSNITAVSSQIAWISMVLTAQAQQANFSFSYGLFKQ